MSDFEEWFSGFFPSAMQEMPWEEMRNLALAAEEGKRAKEKLEDYRARMDMKNTAKMAWDNGYQKALDDVEGCKIPALVDDFNRQLLNKLCDLFGWEDRSYLHAIMHIENAVNNLKADRWVAGYESGYYDKKTDMGCR